MLKRSIAALGLAVLGGASLVGCSSTQDAAKIPHPIQTAWTAPATTPTATPTTHVGPTIPPTTAATTRNVPQEDAQEATSRPERGRVAESPTDDASMSQNGSHGSRGESKSSKKGTHGSGGNPRVPAWVKKECDKRGLNAKQCEWLDAELDQYFLESGRQGIRDALKDKGANEAPKEETPIMPEPTEDDELSELEKIDPPSQDNTPDM